jgi:hypothetical protein
MSANIDINKILEKEKASPVVSLFNYDGCMNTFSGKKFDLFKPDPDMVDILDIAKGLSYNSHFGGHCPLFFSIAQHCLMVVHLLPKNSGRELKLMALLHDAAEAYIGDMIKPLKLHFPLFKEIEDRIMEAVCVRYGLDYKLMMPQVKKYDLKAQEIEFNVFYRNTGRLIYLSPEESFCGYLEMFIMLCK